MPDRPSARTLEQRLAEDVVLGAEGYVFELERRGYDWVLESRVA